MSGLRQITCAGIAAAFILAASPARAWEPESQLAPAVQLHWSFGGAQRGHAAPDLSLQLNYASDPRAARLPAIAQWTVSASGDDLLSVNGVPLASTNLFASETGERQTADPASSGLKVALIILGAGGATALAVSALGNAAEDNNPAVKDNQPGVACAQNPVTSSCAVGGGG